MSLEKSQLKQDDKMNNDDKSKINESKTGKLYLSKLFRFNVIF